MGVTSATAGGTHGLTDTRKGARNDARGTGPGAEGGGEQEHPRDGRR
jgi:hypothetical protein